jgi:hypothetical protein
MPPGRVPPNKIVLPVDGSNAIAASLRADGECCGRRSVQTLCAQTQVSLTKAGTDESPPNTTVSPRTASNAIDISDRADGAGLAGTEFHGTLGVTGFDAADDALSLPNVLNALTVNVYVVPFVKPVTSPVVAVELNVTRVRATCPAHAVTS